MASRLLASVALFAAPAALAEEGTDAALNDRSFQSRRVERDGVVVEFTLQRPGAKGEVAAPLDGDAVEARFRLADATTGAPLRGLSPAAWIDVAGGAPGRDGAQQSCRERVSLYLKGLVGVRPMIDLNSYFLLVLNADPSISVIDPLVSMTGRTSLYATVVLPRPGADWALSKDGRRLFVSMPAAGALAVVSTESFKVERTVEAGRSPARLALQPDGRYLWIGDNAGGGVAVLDTETLRVAGRVRTGRGHHEIAFTPDSRRAFVTNRDDGTVTVVDVATLRRTGELRPGPVPISVAFSPLSRMLYVVEAKEGAALAVDAETLQVVARMPLPPGAGPLRFSNDGRWGLVAHPAENAVHVVDALTNRVAHVLPVPGKPYQVSLTRGYGYVRLLDSEQVAMIPLASLASEKAPGVKTFAAGAGAPKLAGDPGIADSLVPASTEAAVFLVNPADNATYYYMEGMNATAGSFANYGHNARAVMLADRSLREVEPGTYAARLAAPPPARYDVAFLLDSPRLLHCFALETKANPALHRAQVPLEIEYPGAPRATAEGGVVRVLFRLRDAATHAPKAGLRDVAVRAFASPGRARADALAAHVGEGLYEARLPVERAGLLYVYVAVPSQKVAFGDIPYRTLGVAVPGTPEKKR